MTILRIEHRVTGFERWKQAFDADPLAREQSGVRRYTVLTSVDDPDYVLVDLEFDTADEAESMLEALRALWGRVDVMRDPKARIVDVVETRELHGGRSATSDAGDPARRPDVPPPAKLPDVDSPPPEAVLDEVPDKEKVVERAQPVDEIVGDQPTVEDLLGGDR